MFSKLDVNGDAAAPLYKYLTSQETSPVGPGDISWNFEKFLIGRDGKILKRFAPRVTPGDAELIKAIEAEIGKG
jgi:glutathione peroxidase